MRLSALTGLAASRRWPRWRALLIPVLAVLCAFAIGGVLILLAGKPPLTAYRAMIHSAFGTRNNWGETLVKMVPLLLAGLGTALAFRARIFNIGAEGQIYMGALGAAVVGLFLGDLPAVLGIPLVLTAGFVGGGLWGGIAGWLKKQFQANEIIVTLMMNYIAIAFVSYLLSGPWRDPAGTEPFTARLAEGTWLPVILPGTRLHAGLVVALLAAVALWWVLRNTVYGYQITVAGANNEAARYGGIRTGRLIVLTMFLSGGLAGLAGVGEVAGVHKRVIESFSPGYGYTAIAIAMLGGADPLGVVVAAFLFAALVIGVNGMQDLVGVPVSIVFIIEGLVLLFVLGSEHLRRKRLIPEIEPGPPDLAPATPSSCPTGEDA
jgi:simple sugar transport system permease protein